jgi:hypothetical protein
MLTPETLKASRTDVQIFFAVLSRKLVRFS